MTKSSATNTKRGPYSAGREKREKICDAVLEVIRDEGIAAVTHRTVSQRADVPVASTTYYFKSKQEMLRSAFDHFSSKGLERLGDAEMSYRRGTRSIQKAITEIEAMLHEELKNPQGEWIVEVELMLAIERDPELAPNYQAFQQKLDRILTALLADLGSSDPKRHARLVRGFIRGFELEQLIESKNGTGLRGFRRDLKELLSRLVDRA